MLTLAHIIQPGVFPPGSDLYRAQPITLASIESACAYAQSSLSIEAWASEFTDERVETLPKIFRRLPPLTRTINSIRPFPQPRKLALLADILRPLDTATSAEHIVYTNVDIGVQPHFYTTIGALIESGLEAFVINRRTIPDHYSDLRDLPLMLAEMGTPHKGYDCFVFKRSLLPRLRLGHLCVGAPWVGRALLANLLVNSDRFKEFRKLHATFHIGNARAWQSPGNAEYERHNRGEFEVILTQLERNHGPFTPEINSYLRGSGATRVYPVDIAGDS